jgi:hypothetical protein
MKDDFGDNNIVTNPWKDFKQVVQVKNSVGAVTFQISSQIKLSATQDAPSGRVTGSLTVQYLN